MNERGNKQKKNKGKKVISYRTSNNNKYKYDLVGVRWALWLFSSFFSFFFLHFSCGNTQFPCVCFCTFSFVVPFAFRRHTKTTIEFNLLKCTHSQCTRPLYMIKAFIFGICIFLRFSSSSVCMCVCIDNHGFSSFFFVGASFISFLFSIFIIRSQRFDLFCAFSFPPF